MRTIFLLLFCFVPSVFAEEAVRAGSIYAEVEAAPAGKLEVIEVRSDLPDEMDSRIVDWLQRQPIVLPASGDTRRVMKISYEVFEHSDGTQYLDMEVVDTDAQFPAETMDQVSIKVDVHILENGEVAEVRPLSALPPGVSEQRLVQAVEESVENDPVIVNAVADGTLGESNQTITVTFRPSDN